MGKLVRPSWHQYFMGIARLVATRATCTRRKVGAILVKDRRILCSGYNGAPTGVDHCDVTGCLREQLNVPSGQKHELCRGVHAEQNAIVQAAYHGIAAKDSTLYCTHKPCSICAKMLINAGIKEIYFVEGYDDPMSETMLAQAGIALIQIKDEVTP